MTKSSSKKIIIWDFDGVIVDSIPYKYGPIWKDVFSDEVEKEESVISFLNTEKGKLVNRYGLIAHSLGITGSDDQIKNDINVRKYAEKYRKCSVDGVIKIGMFAGAKEVLQSLSDQGHTMYIVSGGGNDEDLKQITDGLSISHFFNGIFGFGDIKMPLVTFGKFENFKRIAEIEGTFDSEKYLVIGDGESDYILSKEIGCDFIGVHSKWNMWNSNNVMKSFTVSDIEEILERVNKLEK